MKSLCHCQIKRWFGEGRRDERGLNLFGGGGKLIKKGNDELNGIGRGVR